MSSNKNDKELNVVKLVAEMAQKKFTERLTPKTLDIIRTVEKFIQDNKLIIFVIELGHRRNIYKK